MLIGIDASRANKPIKTGVEWYSYHVIEQLKKMAPAEVKFLLYTGEALTGGLEICPVNFLEKHLVWLPKYLWTQIRLWWELLLNPPDVLFVPAHTIPFLFLSKKIKVAVTVHDVGFKRFPELYKRIQYWYHELTMWRIKRRADIILTVSEFSKQEIVKLYNILPDKITVAPLGFDASQYNKQSNQSADVLHYYGITTPYLLYVGRIERKKNVIRMVEAFNILAKSNSQLKLVLAGGDGNELHNIKQKIADYKLENRILLLGYVKKEHLPIIMSSAVIFLFPTLYEGFGIPILEAMACGVPVVTSNINPHQEVAGVAAVLADAKSEKDLAEKIAELLADEVKRKELIIKGLERVKDFSWEKTAKIILARLLK
ncbi:MAG: glycosyltransferase family 1 protein [bacterium]